MHSFYSANSSFRRPGHFDINGLAYDPLNNYTVYLQISKKNNLTAISNSYCVHKKTPINFQVTARHKSQLVSLTINAFEWFTSFRKFFESFFIISGR